MNTSELIENVRKNLKGKLPKSDIKLVVNEVLSVTKSQIRRGDKLVLKGFGTFSKVRKKARAGVHPATGESIRIKAHSNIKFVPSVSWKGTLNPKRN